MFLVFAKGVSKSLRPTLFETSLILCMFMFFPPKQQTIVVLVLVLVSVSSFFFSTFPILKQLFLIYSRKKPLTKPALSKNHPTPPPPNPHNHEPGCPIALLRKVEDFILTNTNTIITNTNRSLWIHQHLLKRPMETVLPNRYRPKMFFKSFRKKIALKRILKYSCFTFPSFSFRIL